MGTYRESASSRPMVRSDVLVRSIVGETVVWSPISSEPVRLGPLTSTLFQLLDGEVSVGELTADLCDVLQVGEGQASDVLRHELAILDNAGLLTTSLPTERADRRDRSADVFPAPPNP